MECKEKNSFSFKANRRVLIETLWNVKPDGRRGQASEPAGFNRNIEECKGILPASFAGGRPWFNRNIVECKVCITYKFLTE